MGEISREITTELSRLVEADLPALDDSATATGAGGAGMPRGAGSTMAAPEDRLSEPEAASAAGEPVPQSGGGPDRLQPNSAASGAAELPLPAVELADSESEPRCAAAGDGGAGGLPLVTGAGIADGHPRVAGGVGGAGRRGSIAGGNPRPRTRRPPGPAPESESSQATSIDVAELLPAARPPELEGAAPTTEP